MVHSFTEEKNSTHCQINGTNISQILLVKKYFYAFCARHTDDYSYYFDLEKEESHPVGRAGQQRGDHCNDFL